MRYRAQFCYVEARFEPDPASAAGSNSLELCRLRFFGPDRWSLAIYSYAQERYEASVFADGGFIGRAVDGFDDQPGTAPLAEERRGLRALAEAARTGLRILADANTDLEPWADDPEAFSFQVSALIENDLESRGQLLAERSTRERTRTLLRLLPALVQQVQSRSEVKVRSRSNGKGHHGHDIVTET